MNAVSKNGIADRIRKARDQPRGSAPHAAGSKGFDELFSMMSNVTQVAAPADAELARKQAGCEPGRSPHAPGDINSRPIPRRPDSIYRSEDRRTSSRPPFISFRVLT